jgi:hypothetical protein
MDENRKREGTEMKRKMRLDTTVDNGRREGGAYLRID